MNDVQIPNTKMEQNDGNPEIPHKESKIPHKTVVSTTRRVKSS